jgi:hypothetical protein
VCKAVTQVYRLRREPLSLSDTAKAGPIAKQKEVAEQRQRDMLAAKGTSKPTVTMNLRKVHELIANEYAKKGIANLTTTFVRTVCQLADRMLGCSRPQDPAGHLADTEDFLGASGFADAQKVAVRFYDTKDSKSKSMNQHTRQPQHQQIGKLASSVTFERSPKEGNLRKPPYFEFYDEYYRRRRDMVLVHGDDEPVNVQVNNMPFKTTRLYRTHKGTPQTTSSISAECLKLLKTSGAIPTGSNLKAKHIRHTTLSYANYVSRAHLRRAVLRARHDEHTFDSTYSYRVDDESRGALDSLPHDAILDDILLG